MKWDLYLLKPTQANCGSVKMVCELAINPIMSSPTTKRLMGRRGKTWVFGAFEPATGQAFTLCHERRDSFGYIQLLEGVFEHFPAKEWVFIADNLSTP